MQRLLQASRVVLALLLFIAACRGGEARFPADAKTTVLSLKNADCASCAFEAVEKLETMAGVYQARFDKKKVELTVIASPSFDAFAEVTAISHPDEYQVVLGPGQGSYLPWKPAPEGADVKIVAENGEDVPDLSGALAPGKVTVVDFSAPWCGPCRKLDAHLLQLVASRGDVAYRKLDVGDWDTPLAKRYLTDVSELPYVIVYDKRGGEVATITGLDLAKLDAAIETGASR